MLEERRRMRAVAKEVQLREQRAKAAQKEEANIARLVNQQLKNDSKQAARGKKKTITPQLSDGEDVGVELSSITWKLCYTYVRATVGASYPPPAYYAAHLCERGRCYLREWFAPERSSQHYSDYLNEKQRIEDQVDRELESELAKFPAVETPKGKRKAPKSEAQRVWENTSKNRVESALEERYLGKVEGGAGTGWGYGVWALEEGVG
ncbi:hypothetical protein CC80DRAFT_597609 [Byssothecium circinans]|uniref:Uncharacterized protein n=1 Tax=Byssothecium circinans TaxID=147558 RepID=A0A6A5THL2_9PLEO|nr:hypothetical protein CC80DRAFT_597609 [Byssothecium circinans]